MMKPTLKKAYQVFYILKYGKSTEVLEHIFVYAYNQKEAVAICREQVRIQKGRNAFRATTKSPYQVFNRRIGQYVWTV